MQSQSLRMYKGKYENEESPHAISKFTHNEVVRKEKAWSMVIASRILLRQSILKMSKQGQWFSAHEPRIFDILRVFFARGSLAG